MLCFLRHDTLEYFSVYGTALSMWVSLMGEWPPPSPGLQPEPTLEETCGLPSLCPQASFLGTSALSLLGVQSRAESVEKSTTDLPGRDMYAQEAVTVLCPV